MLYSQEQRLHPRVDNPVNAIVESLERVFGQVQKSVQKVCFHRMRTLVQLACIDTVSIAEKLN